MLDTKLAQVKSMLFKWAVEEAPRQAIPEVTVAIQAKSQLILPMIYLLLLAGVEVEPM